jgi:dienelactone hydrolase
MRNTSFMTGLLGFSMGGRYVAMVWAPSLVGGDLPL